MPSQHRDPNADPNAPNGHNLIGAFGFLKTDVVRCMAFTKAGDPCQAPAKKGIRFCVNHKKLALDFPGDHPDRPAPPPIRVQVKGRTGVIEIDPRDQSRRLAIAQKQAQQDLIAQMTQEYEIAPQSVFEVMREGLRATKTVRRRRLDADGLEVSIDGDPVYDEVEEIDHDHRLDYMRELLDRLYGKPKARQEITGGGGGPVTVVGLVQNLVKLEQAQKSGEIQNYYEDTGEEPLDVEATEV